MNSIFDTPEYRERWAMYDSALKAGIPIVSTETCAIICAMLLVWGNTEEFTHNHRLVCELQYAQKRFGIEGGETPKDRNLTIVEPAHARLSESELSDRSRSTAALTIVEPAHARLSESELSDRSRSTAAFLTALNYYTDLLTLNQQREDRVPDHIDQMFQERYGFHFNRE